MRTTLACYLPDETILEEQSSYPQLPAALLKTLLLSFWRFLEAMALVDACSRLDGGVPRTSFAPRTPGFQ